METWFKTGGYWNDRIDPITAVVVIKISPQMITLEAANLRNRNIRTYKRSSYANYFPTFDEAVEFLRSKYESEQDHCNHKVQQATKKRNEFEKWASTATAPTVQKTSI